MNNLLRAALATLLLTSIGTVHAEGGCPPGMVPYRAGAGADSCGPMPSTTPPVVQTGPRWDDRWGAIAVDESNGVMGAVDSHSSKRSAKKGAIAECVARGGVKCKIRREYYNQCVVTVQGDKTAHEYLAGSVEHATYLGMQNCEKAGDTDCHVYYQACSMPVRIR